MSTFNTSMFGGFTSSGGQQVTPRNLIHDAIRALGGLRGGQETSADNYAEYLRWLNNLVDSWNAERLMISAVVRSLSGAGAGTAELAVGSAKLEAVGWIGDGSREARLSMLAFNEWAAIGDRTTAGSVSAAYYDGETVFLHQPPAAAGTLVLYQWQTIEQFPDLDTPYGFRPGYARALTYGLAVEIAPAAEIHQKIRTSRLSLVMQQAQDAKTAIKRMNVPRGVLSVDDALLSGGGFNILSGDF